MLKLEACSYPVIKLKPRHFGVKRTAEGRPECRLAGCAPSTPPPLYGTKYTMNQTVVGASIPQILKKVAAKTGAHFVNMLRPLGE